MSEILTGKKLFRTLTASAILLIAVMIVCSFIGSEKVSIKNVIRQKDSSISPDFEILTKVRIPRVILACLVGAALSCAGVVFQAILRNPLADPYILGVSSGAGLGSITAILLGLSFSFAGVSSTGIAAFFAALGTVWLVWFIGGFTGRSNVTGLLLAGVVVNAFFSAIIMFLTSIARSAQLQSTIFWLMGNMTEQSFSVLWFTGGIILAGIAGLFLIAPQLNVISFGSEDAANIGINTARTKNTAFILAALITAIAVSLSGLIGFVGLVVPHAVRLVFGPDHRRLIPLSAIFGAMLLVIADTFARTIVAPAQLPVGVVTAIFGGPFFLALLIKYTKKIGWQNR